MTETNGAHPGKQPKYPLAQTVAEILAIDDMADQVIDIEEWRRSVIMRPLTQQETEQIMQAATTADPETGKPKTDLIRANRMAVAQCLVTPALTLAEMDVLCTQHAGSVVSELIQAHLTINHWDRMFGGGTPNGKVGEGSADAAFPVESVEKTSV